jgi:hypothetical protein
MDDSEVVGDSGIGEAEVVRDIGMGAFGFGDAEVCGAGWRDRGEDKASLSGNRRALFGSASELRFADAGQEHPA